MKPTLSELQSVLVDCDATPAIDSVRAAIACEDERAALHHLADDLLSTPGLLPWEITVLLIAEAWGVLNSDVLKNENARRHWGSSYRRHLGVFRKMMR